MSRTYKPFSGPFAPMLTEFLAQKEQSGINIWLAIGYFASLTAFRWTMM